MKTDTLRGTCSACFREMDTTETAMGRHGWQEGGGRRVGIYGRAWHSGECFGVARKPFEISPEGTIAWIGNLRGWLTNLNNALAKLAKRPALLVEKRVSYAERTARKADGKLPEMIELKPGDLDYDRTLKNKVSDIEHEREVITREIADCERRVAEWKPGTLLPKTVKVPTVHMVAERREQAIAACMWGRMLGSMPIGLTLTNDKAAVTCSRCKRSMAADEAARAKSAAVNADADALVEHIRTAGKPIPASVIKEALGWDTKRFNRAVDRASFKRVSSDFSSPTKYFVKNS